MTKLPFDAMRTARADDGIGRVVYFGEATTIAKAFTNDDHFVGWLKDELRDASIGREVAIAEQAVDIDQITAALARQSTADVIDLPTGGAAMPTRDVAKKFGWGKK